jgi:hypothetical protein
MSDDEERREKKKRRKRGQKSKTKEQDTVKYTATNEENIVDEGPIQDDGTIPKQEDTEDNGEDKPKRKQKRKRKSKQTEGGQAAASGTGDKMLYSDKLTLLDLTADVEGNPF